MFYFWGKSEKDEEENKAPESPRKEPLTKIEEESSMASSGVTEPKSNRQEEEPVVVEMAEVDAAAAAIAVAADSEDDAVVVEAPTPTSSLEELMNTKDKKGTEEAKGGHDDGAQTILPDNVHVPADIVDIKSPEDETNDEVMATEEVVANVEEVANKETVAKSEKLGWDRKPAPYQAFREDQVGQESGADDIDLDLVEHYDNTFNEFISEHTRFLIANPDLVHNLRVSKLQKLLERGDQLENELIQQLEQLQVAKTETQQSLHQQLMDAARMKAAREIHLHSKYKELKYNTKAMEAKLKWELVSMSESRAKKQYNLRQDLKNTVVGTDRLDLLAILPQGSDFQAIRDAILTPVSTSTSQNGNPLSKEEENDLRQFQMDNAFLNAEVTVLQKKLDYYKLASKKNAWVESVLVRMDPKTFKKLKAKHQKKTGVPL